jgi:hypothetical protein
MWRTRYSRSSEPPITDLLQREAKRVHVEDKVGVDHQNLPVLTSSTERPKERMWRTRYGKSSEPPSTDLLHREANSAHVEDKVGVDHQNLPVLTSSTERPREHMRRTR